jgi:hypothetical protein
VWQPGRWWLRLLLPGGLRRSGARRRVSVSYSPDGGITGGVWDSSELNFAPQLTGPSQICASCFRRGPTRAPRPTSRTSRGRRLAGRWPVRSQDWDLASTRRRTAWRIKALRMRHLGEA